MNISTDITMYDIAFLIFSALSASFALFQWRQSYKLKRAECLKEALSKIRDDKDFAIVLYDIDYGENWYTENFLSDHTNEQRFDAVFAYFDYLCYLKNKHILSKSEFRVFEYRISRMANNDSFLDYMFNLYHFSKRNEKDISFYHLLIYLRKNKLLDDDFWNANSKRYVKRLNF